MRECPVFFLEELAREAERMRESPVFCMEELGRENERLSCVLYRGISQRE